MLSAKTVSDAQDEIACLRAWGAGDQAAGDRLVRRHYASVLRFFELKVTSVAPDLTQRTFLACVESIRRYRGDSTLKGYIFGVARNVLNTHLREVQTAAIESWSESSAGGGNTSVSTVVARRQEHVMLLRGLASLDMDYQIPLSLHYFEGLKAREIADALDVPISTVTTRLARGRAMLRKQVSAQERPGPAREALLRDVDACAASIELISAPVPPNGLAPERS